MNKVGIATFHYADNYGAVLQAWALRKVINKMPNTMAEIINYVPENYSIIPYLHNEIGIEKMRAKRGKFEDFLKTECGICTPMKRTITGEDFNICCVGSDQVWNMKLRENVNKEYLFPNIKKSIDCFSYAASTGGCIEKEDEKYFIENLKKFKGIAVREIEAVDRLKNLGLNDVICTIDPTLLLDRSDYEKLIVKPSIIEENYLFFFSYELPDNELRKYLTYSNAIARCNRLKVVHSLSNVPDWIINDSGCTTAYDGIGEFLWHIKNASVVVTTSFHGAILGYIFERPTYIITRRKGDERLCNLARLLGLENNIIDKSWIEKELLIKKTDYKKDKVIDLREKSLEYLQRMVSI